MRYADQQGRCGLSIVDPLRHPDWDELLLAQQEYSFFHSASWARVLSESYRYRPLYFTEIRKDKLSVLVPMMEVKSLLTGTRGVGLPFTDYCEPIVPEQGRCRDVMEEIIRYGRGASWDSVEVRSGNGFAPAGQSSAAYFVHILDLRPGPDRLFAAFRGSTRRNIRKAVKDGVRVQVEASPEALHRFYELNCRTRREHGLPPQPLFFFRKVHEHVISRNLGFIVLGCLNGRDVAGAVYFTFGRKSMYKYGASLRDYQHLRPNNLVMWEAIQECCRQGQRSFCFGRTDPDQTGLRQFKAGWGGEERIIGYYRYDTKSGELALSRSWSRGIHTAIYRRLPLPLLKVMGRFLYRHVG